MATAGMSGRAALITGSSRGIGLASAKALLERGAGVCLTGRDPDSLAAVAADLAVPDRVVVAAGDSADPDHRRAAVELTVGTFGSIDYLVNNTGTGTAAPLLDTDPEDLRTIFDANVVAGLSFARLARDAYMGEHGGAIVNVASVAGFRTASNIGAYALSKAALIQATTQLAYEMGPDVRVNAVAPAIVRTQFAAALYDGREAEIAANYPLRRLGIPEDVAGAVAFLLSNEAAWITGQTVVIDGGLFANSVIDF